MAFAFLMIGILSALTTGPNHIQPEANALDEKNLMVQSAKLFDRYGGLSSNDEKARLDNYAIELQRDPTSTGYIIVYGRRSRPGEAKKRADRQKKYLWYSRGVDTNRLVSLDHCFKSQLEVELWIVPGGAKPPVPCATKTPAKARTTTVRPR
jgi:hypothetical protein